jgi:hypothetical protein
MALWLLVALVAGSAAGSTLEERQGMTASATETLEALWQALKDHYPMMEYAGARGDEWLEEFRPKVAAAPTREAAFCLMDELVCRLNDYHTRLLWPGRPRHDSPWVRAEEVRDGRRRVVAIVAAAPDTGLKPGDEVLTVDGRPVREALAEAWRHSVGATAAARSRNACWRMLLGPREQPVTLRVRARSQRVGREVTVRRDLPVPRESVVSHREVESVPVIRITQWGDRGEEKVVAAFDRLLERFRQRPHLVIDVRGNGGGSDAMADEVTGRFLTRPVISSISFHRLVPELAYRRTVEWAQPGGPWRYEGRVAVLIDEGCASAC